MKIITEIKKWKNFMISSIVLAVFFILPYFHNWANNFFIKLHFCDHTYCMVFSIIWFGFAFFTWKKKKSYFDVAIIVLIVGIILMNLIPCDASGKLNLGSFTLFNIEKENKECILGIDCPGDVVEVPIPPCLETDDGRDYITFGTIRSGVDLDDICMGDTLRERYCNSETTYTSEDIDCTIYGVDWTCEEGECRERTTIIETPTLPTASETNCGDGIDNDDDDLIDCFDSDCSSICGDFEYSCQHISESPTCGGTCPSGEECVFYLFGESGWCECMPIGEISCGSSYPSCDGWCGENYACVPTIKGCTCIFTGIEDCYESDGEDNPLLGGYCYDFNTGEIYYDECMSSFVLGEYKCVEGYGCDLYSIICQNDTDYGLLDYSCFEEIGGAFCGEY